MKPEDIFDAVGKIDNELLDREEKITNKNWKNIFVRVGAVAASFAVIAMAMTYTVNRFTTYPPTENTTDGGTNNVLSGEDTTKANDELSTTPVTDDYTLWVDDREYKDGAEPVIPNYAYEWPWECRELHSQFNTIMFNGNKFGVHAYWDGWEKGLTADMLVEKLGDGIGEGFDLYEEISYEIGCEIFSIKNVDPDQFVAIKYNGYDRIYVASTLDKPEYKTLGDMISSLNLTKNIAFSKFYHTPEVGVTPVLYGLSADASAALWQLIASYAHADCVGEPEWGYWADNEISLTLESSVLGMKNLSFTINRQGYIFTNLMRYAHYFYIGEDAAAEIIAFVLDNKADPPAPDTFKLVGHITEIGEDYIKIDDSVMMKNEEEGKIFTVHADDIKVKRYIMRDILSVGDLIVITHKGIYAESPTEVYTAIGLEEASHVSTDGEVYIPE